MGLELAYIDGQTPLDEEEKDGLLIPTIATRGELDEFEQQNIEQAVQWTLGRSFKPETVFTEDFIRMVHKRMYADVWAWAGEFRKTNKNIGTDKWQIPRENLQAARIQLGCRQPVQRRGCPGSLPQSRKSGRRGRLQFAPGFCSFLILPFIA